MIFAIEPYFVTPYRPLGGNLDKNDVILAKCLEHPERFLVSQHVEIDPRYVVARRLTSPDNAVWEVWNGATFCGILVLDHITPFIDARWQFVFFDDELASKVEVLREFVKRCFSELGFVRLTIETPAESGSVLTSFARRKLDAHLEGKRACGYFGGQRWQDVVILGILVEEIYGPIYDSDANSGRRDGTEQAVWRQT